MINRTQSPIPTTLSLNFANIVKSNGTACFEITIKLLFLREGIMRLNVSIGGIIRRQKNITMSIVFNMLKACEIMRRILG